jgi:N-acetylneuraminic acid mutarotase
MKKLLLTLLALSSSLLAFSQGTWTPRDTLPYDTNAMFQGMAGFSIGSYGYAGIGQNLFRNTDDFWRFDPSTNSWTQKAPFPGRARVAPASFVIGDKAYIVTGSISNGFPCVTECWAYDATTDTWTQKANFPGAARVYAVGFAIDSLGYVGTGANELADFRKDFYAYHPSIDTWTRIADFGGIARDACSGFGVNGKGYVCFGQDSTHKSYKDMWEYDPVANTWTQKADNSYPICVASGFVICSNIYIGFGDSTQVIDDTRKFWKYNTITDTWTQEADIPGIKTFEGAAFSIGDTGYCGFGFDTAEVPVNAFYKFFAGDSCSVISESKIISEISEIEIYPNPFNNKCTIKLPDAFKEVAIFNLCNMEGLKLNIDLHLHGNNNYYTLNRAGLIAGVYILSISYRDWVYYKKLVITD